VENRTASLYSVLILSITLDLKSHELVIGEIIETHVTEDCVTGEKPDPEKIDPHIYTPGVLQYQRLGEIVGKAFHIGKD